MLKFFSLIILTAFTTFSYGQELPKDNSGKIRYHEEISLGSAQIKEIYFAANDWAYKNFSETRKSILSDSIKGQIKAVEYFLVYQKKLFSKKVHGAIRYNLTIEIKDNAYVYDFNDFVFEHYKINKKQQYLPSGKETALGEENFKGDEKAWANHKKNTLNKVNSQIASLNSAMKQALKLNKQKSENQSRN